MKKPRGMRNNNPFNIIRTNTKWQGMAEYQADPRFITFDTLEMGVRAGLVNLYNGYFKKGLTVQQMIHKYAPPHENDSDSYARHVAQMAKVAVEKKPPQDRWLWIAAAIVFVEQGYQAVSYGRMKGICEMFPDKLNIYLHGPGTDKAADAKPAGSKKGSTKKAG